MADNDPEDDFDPRCVTCSHRESRHPKYGGLCKGDTTRTDYYCGCTKFLRPKVENQQPSYTTWDPGKQKEQTGFSVSSSRREIGDGRGGGRPYLQAVNKGHEKETPEWVMFGVRQPNGSVMLFASTELSYMSLRQDASYFDELHRDMISAGKLKETPWDLRGRMVDYVPINAENYVDALALLMRSGWRPGGEDLGPEPPQEPTTADLQRQAALDDLRRTQERSDAVAVPVEEIVDAEIVEEDDDDAPTA